jgi:hypothetical protein
MDTGVYPAFIGQPISTYWARPIRQYGDTWYIGNGNYLAKLGTDETSFEAKFKQLPSGYQCQAIEVNGSDILISAVANNGSSHILMWDGFSDGWNTDVLVSRAPSALKAYKLGWVYLADGVIYYTDGRSIEELVSFPDDKNLEQMANPISYNGIAIVGDTMYFAVSNNNLNRGQRGVLVFNPKTGLSFFKAKVQNKAFSDVYCIYNFPQTRIDSLYSTNNNIELGCWGSYNNLRIFASSSYSYDNKSFVYMIDLQEETQIKQIWLNLKRTSKVYSREGQNQCQITVSAGNGNCGIIRLGQINSIPTTTTINNTLGNIYPLEVGDEIEFVDGDVSGQRTFVTSITNGGTTSETATIDPPLSTTSSGSSNIRIWKVKKFETKIISETELSKPIVFNGNFLGSKMYLEVTVTGISNSFPVSIQDILLF